MASERLWVVRDRQVLATLERIAADDLRLTYEPEVVQQALGLPLISTSLLVRTEPYLRDELLPFFDGLLPEGPARTQLARRLRLDVLDVFGFLREIGRDCAGALALVPEGTDLTALVAVSDIEWLSTEQVATKIGELSERPLAVEPAESIRISLAGVQDKMAVVVEGTRIGLPRGLTASTHILKPASREYDRRGRLAYPGLLSNEASCLTLAHQAGLRVPTVEIRSVANEAVLLIERYDRVRQAGHVRRLHQEDFGQALGVPTSRKYEKDGGPGVDRFLQLLRTWSKDTPADVDELMDRIGFNYLIGNADAHAKNSSLLYGDQGIRLAPAYDLLSTHVYPSLNHEMGTAINGMLDPRELKAIHWQKWLRALDLSAARYGGRLAELADRVEAAIPTTREWAAAQGIADPLFERIAQLVATRVGILRGIATKG